MTQLDNIEAIEKRLWASADTLRANSNYASNEYFLTGFADQKAHDGGEFLTHFMELSHKNPTEQATFYGLEKNPITIRLAKMNLAVHGLEGNIQKAITYYEDPHEMIGKADFVMSSQASSAGGGEAKVRQKLIETGYVDAMMSIRSNFFYTRTVPCELWFLR